MNTIFLCNLKFQIYIQIHLSSSANGLPLSQIRNVNHYLTQGSMSQKFYH